MQLSRKEVKLVSSACQPQAQTTWQGSRKSSQTQCYRHQPCSNNRNSFTMAHSYPMRTPLERQNTCIHRALPPLHSRCHLPARQDATDLPSRPSSSNIISNSIRLSSSMLLYQKQFRLHSASPQVSRRKKRQRLLIKLSLIPIREFCRLRLCMREAKLMHLPS